MSGYSNAADVREVVVGTLRKEGRDPKDYFVVRIIRDTATYRGQGYGWGMTISSDEWNQAVARHRRPAGRST